MAGIRFTAETERGIALGKDSQNPCLSDPQPYFGNEKTDFLAVQVQPCRVG
jgi:hypothetical protein